jgi:hypothetical protein
MTQLQHIPVKVGVCDEEMNTHTHTLQHHKKHHHDLAFVTKDDETMTN